jgi:hypothetical protein
MTELLRASSLQLFFFGLSVGDVALEALAIDTNGGIV